MSDRYNGDRNTAITFTVIVVCLFVFAFIMWGIE